MAAAFSAFKKKEEKQTKNKTNKQIKRNLANECVPPNVWSEMTTCDEMNLFAWKVMFSVILASLSMESQHDVKLTSWVLLPKEGKRKKKKRKEKKANDCLAGRILTLESDYVKFMKETAYVVDCCCWSLLYSAILRSRADSLRSHLILPEWLVFIARFWISTEVVYLQR